MDHPQLHAQQRSAGARFEAGRTSRVERPVGILQQRVGLHLARGRLGVQDVRRRIGRPRGDPSPLPALAAGHVGVRVQRVELAVGYLLHIGRDLGAQIDSFLRKSQGGEQQDSGQQQAFHRVSSVPPQLKTSHNAPASNWFWYHGLPPGTVRGVGAHEYAVSRRDEESCFAVRV